MKKFIPIIIITILAACIALVSANELPITKSVESVNIVMEFESKEIQGEIILTTQINDGSIIAVGSTGDWDEYKNAYMDKRTEGDNDNTAIAVKYTPEGDIAFIKTFGGNRHDRFNYVIATNDGGFIASGYSNSTIGGDFEKYGLTGFLGGTCVLVKYDKDGKVQWARTGAEYEINHILKLYENDKGQICAIGYRITGDKTDYYTMLLETDGEPVNNEEFTILKDFSGIVRDFVLMNDGSYFICGMDKADTLTSDALLNKYNSNGELIFSTIFNGNGAESFDTIITTSDDGVLAVGNLYKTTDGTGINDIGLVLPDNANNKGMLIVKFDNEGSIAGGDILLDSRAVGGRALAGLDDGAALIQFLPIGGFKDPLSGRMLSNPDNKHAYLYRVSDTGKLIHLYSVYSDLLIGPYCGIASLRKLDDGAFRIISAENEMSYSMIRIFDVPDKFRLQSTINQAGTMVKAAYSGDTWNAFLGELESANQINISTTATQEMVDQAEMDLLMAINNLSKDTGNNNEDGNDNPVSNHTPDETKNDVPAEKDQAVEGTKVESSPNDSSDVNDEDDEVNPVTGNSFAVVIILIVVAASLYLISLTARRIANNRS